MSARGFSCWKNTSGSAAEFSLITPTGSETHLVGLQQKFQRTRPGEFHADRRAVLQRRQQVCVVVTQAGIHARSPDFLVHKKFDSPCGSESGTEHDIGVPDYGPAASSAYTAFRPMAAMIVRSRDRMIRFSSSDVSS